ncbi:MAG TPA: DUF4231 domain-containing protein [Ktedonobacteraceae bacterium]|nr:DUF4231 domain-containing protein [Ktedonobacteraceae bacterium]
MDLFKQRPRFRPLSKEPAPLVKDTGKYPALAADFKILDDVLVPSYHKHDREAIKLQNAHWWTYVILIVGGAIATILGILQLAISVEGIGIAGAIIAAFLGCATLALNSFHYQERYMNSRLAAEELRGEYFLFLGRLGQYGEKSQERIEALKERVSAITEKAEV